MVSCWEGLHVKIGEYKVVVDEQVLGHLTLQRESLDHSVYKWPFWDGGCLQEEGGFFPADPQRTSGDCVGRVAFAWLLCKKRNSHVHFFWRHYMFKRLQQLRLAGTNFDPHFPTVGCGWLSQFMWFIWAYTKWVNTKAGKQRGLSLSHSKSLFNKC